MRRLLLASVAALVACGSEPGPNVALSAPDLAVFTSEIDPILTHRCASGSCHGNSERPFALYAVGRRRIPPVSTFEKVPLSEAEIEANYHATRGFLDAPAPRETTLVKKALALGGPESHGGGAVFVGPSDAECRALEAWIGRGQSLHGGGVR